MSPAEKGLLVVLAWAWGFPMLVVLVVGLAEASVRRVERKENPGGRAWGQW